LSVTIPHKEAALTPRQARLDDLAGRQIGAANTLAFGPEGVSAFNTDATAAVDIRRRLREQDALPAEGAIGLENGAGARRRVAAALRRGVWTAATRRRSDGDLAETLDRAKRIAADVGSKAIDWQARYRLPYDCLVNATPVGMHPNVDETPFDKEHLRSYMTVFDTVYNPENTLLVKEARSIGCRIVTGVRDVRPAGSQSIQALAWCRGTARMRRRRRSSGRRLPPSSRCDRPPSNGRFRPRIHRHAQTHPDRLPRHRQIDGGRRDRAAARLRLARCRRRARGRSRQLDRQARA
jgi:shikimate 5-dehydrogenase